MLYYGPQVEHLLDCVASFMQDPFKPFIVLRLKAATQATLDLPHLEGSLKIKALRSIEPGWTLLVLGSSA